MFAGLLVIICFAVGALQPLHLAGGQIEPPAAKDLITLYWWHWVGSVRRDLGSWSFI